MVRRSLGRLLLAAAALAVAMSGCASSGQNGTAPVKPTVTISLPGHPSAGVTDIRAYALTGEQANKIKQACIQGAGIPGAEDECAAAVGAAVTSDKQCSDSNSPCPGAACPGPHSECLYIADLTDQKLAVIEVCARHASPLCGGGTLLPRATVDKLANPGPAASASSTASPSPSPSGSEEPSPSSPAPTTPSGGPPSNPAETGAGSSP
jgi:hypothetical protein